MTAAVAPRSRDSRAAWQLAFLLATAVFINYVDRGNLATAAPVLATELHLSATQIGVLLSSFYWTYAVSQLGAGWLAERYPVQRVIAAGFTLWCIATILTGFASTFAALLLLRLVLGRRRERRVPVQLEDAGGERVDRSARARERHHRDRTRARARIRDVHGRIDPRELRLARALHVARWALIALARSLARWAPRARCRSARRGERPRAPSRRSSRSCGSDRRWARGSVTSARTTSSTSC